ncbi:MAG: hypothetical protein WCP98_09430, partial [Actinomycetes bacterium]
FVTRVKAYERCSEIHPPTSIVPMTAVMIIETSISMSVKPAWDPRFPVNAVCIVGRLAGYWYGFVSK